MDMISELSDDLLLVILSFVPTKDVVGTSLLSKRWRFLWTLLTKLEYGDSNHIGEHKMFSEFVYMSLLSNKANVLDKFGLSVVRDYPFIDYRQWIEIAVSRRVREIEIENHSVEEGYSTMPSSLYISGTLVTLRLVRFVILSIPPGSVCLPSLKSLSLDRVIYAEEETLSRLLSGCPNLDVLFVDRCEDDGIMDIAVVVPSLQRLTLSDRYSGTCDRNVIDVPSLKYLDIRDEVAYDSRQIENMPELVEANVDITHGVTREFLRALTSVRRLSLCSSLSEVMNPHSVRFNRLVHLEVYTIDEGWWDLLAHMLQDSPKLQTLKLIDDHYSDFDAKEIPVGWNPPSSVPECLLFTLESFTWTGYKGSSQGHKMMATYILQNAACLKTATFSPETSGVGERYQMLMYLALVATASTSFFFH
ncbi:unnamed protein product [Cochlearia groenlandica]